MNSSEGDICFHCESVIIHAGYGAVVCTGCGTQDGRRVAIRHLLHERDAAVAKLKALRTQLLRVWREARK